jgi:hypothetical protein
MFTGRLLGRLLRTRGDDRGPIFHAKTSERKDRGAITLCVTPTGDVAGQDYLGRKSTTVLGLANKEM